MDGKWCLHMVPFTTIEVPKADFVEPTRWNFCPICAAPRPKESVKLAEKFREYVCPIDCDHKKHQEGLAQVALEHFRDIVNDSKHRGSLACFSKMDLLKRMEDSI